MKTTYVEYDESGELFHVCTVETTEGNLRAPDPTASDEEKVAYTAQVQQIISDRDKAVRNELATHVANGKRLLVLPPNAAVPIHGRHRVINGAIKARTDAEFTAWQNSQNSQNPAHTP